MVALSGKVVIAARSKEQATAVVAVRERKRQRRHLGEGRQRRWWLDQALESRQRR